MRSSNIPPAEREQWLRNACGDDDKLRSDVAYLLDQETRADKYGFLRPAEVADSRVDTTAEWPAEQSPGYRPDNDARHQATTGNGDGIDRFSPKAGIATAGAAGRPTRPGRSFQSRLRELPLIYVLIFGVMLFLRPVVLGATQSTIAGSLRRSWPRPWSGSAFFCRFAGSRSRGCGGSSWE